MTEKLAQLVVKELRRMDDDAPRDISIRLDVALDEEGLDPVGIDDIVSVLLTDDENAPAHYEFYSKLVAWVRADNLKTPKVPGTTEAGTPERVRHVYTSLGLPESSFDALDAAYELPELSPTAAILSAEEWTDWYPRENQGDFYWRHYRQVLEGKGFGPEAIAELNESTSTIVGRLTDPTQEKPYQSKGLVVGHVQSGKTANFAGTLAKAIDAGYKLIIVLTGTIEILRSQTQKRLDKELLGQENVLGGAARSVRNLEKELAGLDEGDIAYWNVKEKLANLVKDVDYISDGDADWEAGKFNSFGKLPIDENAPRISRLTGAHTDYKALKDRLQDIDFDLQKKVRTKPIYDPANIDSTDVWFAVVKKNSSTLQKLKTDLDLMSTKLSDIPALIIDDEADQASINTKNPKKPGAKKSSEEKERTAINRHISDILRAMPRCQYLAYTATPFANVFVDPSDYADVFPKDFIVPLKPSPDYMGATAYHDLDGEPEDPTFATSKRKAYFRPVEVDEGGYADDPSLMAAIRSFVLAGAIKLWRREKLGDPGSLRHHTMLVHEAATVASHDETAKRIGVAWARAGFTSPRGLAELKELWETDFEPVSLARANGAPVPESFAELREYIPQAVQKIESGSIRDGMPSCVVVVNGNGESEFNDGDIDFDGRNEIWKIVVGGAKLSRGFTVEGLTITVFTRVTMAADTLTQMGRWYGYRKYYGDLIRLFMGRGIDKKNRSNDISIYDVFTDIARDEESFRSELWQYAQLDENGRPRITPAEVGPLVWQRVPWLKPTAANKMYNSQIVEEGIGGKAKDMFQMKLPGTGANSRNLTLLQDLFQKFDGVRTFATDSGTPYRAAYGVLDVDEVLEFLKKFEFLTKESYQPTINFIKSHKRIPLHGIDDFVVFLPLLSQKGIAQRIVPGLGDTGVGILQRTRRPQRDDFSGSSARQRATGEVIAGSPAPSGLKKRDVDGHWRAGGPLARELAAEGRGRRGALMITLAAEQKDGRATKSAPEDLPKAGITTDCDEVVALLTVTLPYHSAEKGVIQRTVQIKTDPHNPIVDDPAAKPKA